MKYNLLVIGAGPGGYVAALRAAQLGLRVAIVERDSLGGVCLNWGCIPTKALLQCAHVCDAMKTAATFGLEVTSMDPNLSRMVDRSREVAATMSKGVQFLLNKAKVEIIMGEATFVDAHTLRVVREGAEPLMVQAMNVIIATGARPRQLDTLPIDQERVVDYRGAMTLRKQPARMVVVGSGAIGSEFAQFYHAIGTQVTLVEALPQLLPLEDDEVGRTLGRALRKSKMKTICQAKVMGVEHAGDHCVVHLDAGKGEELLEADVVLSAVGIVPNLEELNLEAIGVTTERGRVVVDEHYRTSVEGVYAIGDVIATPALAHVASAEATHCVEHIAGREPHAVDYGVIPACTYTTPEVASVGARERDLVRDGVPYVVGSFPFMASGKATAIGERDGMVKLLFGADDHRLLGAHIVGANATEMIAELALAMRLRATAEQLHEAMHPHPTLSEAVMEAAAAALGCCVHA